VAPAPPPPPARIKVRVASTPPGAEVWWEAVKKGETPLLLEFPKGEEQIELTLKLAGHVDAKAPLIPSEDQEIAATLTPVPPKAKTRRAATVRRPKADPPTDRGPTSAGEIKGNPYSK
jgi:hypothetical protein